MFKILPLIKKALFKLPKGSYNFATLAKFRQIWSLCP